MDWTWSTKTKKIERGVVCIKMRCFKYFVALFWREKLKCGGGKKGPFGVSVSERIFKTAVHSEPRPSAHTLIIFSPWPLFSLQLPASTPAHAISCSNVGLRSQLEALLVENAMGRLIKAVQRSDQLMLLLRAETSNCCNCWFFFFN